MTCIVGIETPNGVWMGGDSASSNSYDMSQSDEPKVFWRKDLLIGFTSDWRFGQLLRYRLDILPNLDELDPDEYMATVFVDAVRACMDDNGYLRREASRESAGNCLIAYQGRLYEMQDYFDVMRQGLPYNSVGSGSLAARGALAALHITDPDRFVNDAEGAVLTALEVAERHNPFCRGPFIVEFQEAPEPEEDEDG